MPFKTKALRRAQIIPSTTFIQIPLLDSSSDGVFWQKCVGHLDSSKGSTCYEFTYLLTHCQDSFIFLGVMKVPLLYLPFSFFKMYSIQSFSSFVSKSSEKFGFGLYQLNLLKYSFKSALLNIYP